MSVTTHPTKTNHILEEVTLRFYTSLQNFEKLAVQRRLHELVDSNAAHKG